MLNSSQKEFLDTLARAICLEAMEQTGKGDYTGMRDYVIYEASYEEIMLSVFDKKNLSEQTMYKGKYIDTDIERARRLSQIEKALSPILGTGIALFASGAVDQNVTDPLAKKLKGYTPSGKTNLWGGFIKTAGGMLTWTAISLAVKILLKFLMVSIEKTKSVCKVACKKQFKEGSPNYALNIKICTSKCKLQGLTSTVSRLRSEAAKCDKTPNPEKCKKNLVKIIAKYNDLILEERKKLKSYTAQLRSRQSIENKTGESKSSKKS